MRARPRDLAERMSGQKPEIFVLPIEAARVKAREVLNQPPEGGYTTVVESWQQLSDGRIEFGVRRLLTRD